jgi:hypothetical protein
MVLAMPWGVTLPVPRGAGRAASASAGTGPTDNLDLAGVRRPAEAPAAYRVAVIVAGHDLPFLETLGITRWLRQDREEGLSES